MSLDNIVEFFTIFIEKNEKKKINEIVQELKNKKKQFNVVIDAYFQVLKEPVPYGFKKNALDYLEKFVLSYNDIESIVKAWKLAKSGYKKYLLSNIEYESDSASESGSDYSDSNCSDSDYSDSGSESDSDYSDSDDSDSD